MRIVGVVALAVDESTLTGESLPSSKSPSPLTFGEGEVALGDRKNCAFASTVVMRGRGLGIVYATGKETELGKIALLMAGKGDEDVSWKHKIKNGLGLVGTPLQVK